MDCFPQYRVFFNGAEVTRETVMADADRGILLRREMLAQGQYTYLPPEHGEVKIFHVDLKMLVEKPPVAATMKAR
jgi:hypothetical protein